MRTFSSLGLLAVLFLLLAPSVTAQCPVGLPCLANDDCDVPGMPLCWDCICKYPFPGAPVGYCDEKPMPESVKCDTDNNICTMEHCDGHGSCKLMNPPHALDCVPCADPADPCKQGKCDGKGNCIANAVENGTPCEVDGNECTLEECQNGVCQPQLPPWTPAGTPCGNVCLEICNGGGYCVRNPAVPYGYCPVGQPCEGKNCATTKHEKCELLEFEDIEYWNFCLCRGVLIECCDNRDCPVGGPPNTCMKCVKPIEEPEEVGGNCECAVGDSCLIPGGMCQPDTPGQCAELAPDLCDCVAP